MNRQGIFTFTLILTLIPLYLVLADFELDKVTQESFTETVLMETERSNYLRTELEINTDDIIAETLLFYLTLKQGQEVASLPGASQALKFAGLKILEKDAFEDQAQKMIAARLFQYYAQQGAGAYPRLQWQGLEKMLDLNDCSYVRLDAKNNLAEYRFKCALEASIEFNHVRQKFRLPPGYQIKTRGLVHAAA